MSTDDDMMSALASLPSADVEPDVSARIRGRARVVLARERRYRERPALGAGARLYSRAIEPTLVAGACAAYLYWAFTTAFALVH